MARKILLADDSVTAQNMGRKILADAGYEVITVNNGSAALKKIAEAKPDLIVLDVYMPGYSGLEVCQRLKESGDTSRIPILLTVGKLEPFKPEEAKRVRAEGFIVKPFEASELLSALTKLEDKMVPRADSSKPGRFARAIAAVEEGRYDNTVAIDEDTGWKNRISFPSKKKRQSVEPDDGDDPSIYNPINKDLKTVVEPHPAQVMRAYKAEDSVDLGALVPEGLPKDVTPEEIAALAAAAAQVKGLEEVRHPEHQTAQPAPPQQEVPAGASHETSQPAPKAAIAASAKTEENGVRPPETPFIAESKPLEAAAMGEPTRSSIEFPSDGAVSPLAAATFAGQEPNEEKKSEAETAPPQLMEEVRTVPSPVAAATIDPALVSGPALNSEDGSASNEGAPRFEPEPVTMAAAAGAGHNGATSRWIAVSVALAPEETGIALEDEMRRVYAAFVGASTHTPKSAAVPEVQPALAVRAESAENANPIEAPALVEPEVANHPAEATPMMPPPEPTESATPTMIATESPVPVVKDFEPVGAPVSEPVAPIPPEPEFVQPAPLIDPATVAQAETPTPAAQAEVAAPTEPATEPIVPAIEVATVAETPSLIPDPTVATQSTEVVTDSSNYSQEQAPQTADTEPLPQLQPEAAAIATVDPASAIAAEAPKAVEPPATLESPVDQAPASPVSAETAEPMATVEPTPRGTTDMAKKEKEIAATTAAAWASWRRIRETGDSKNATAPPATPTKNEVVPESAPKDEAAMAVAAGAEKAPEDVSAAPEESPEIASIVDSVLADLRPKIVEEISRKLGKKK